MTYLRAIASAVLAVLAIACDSRPPVAASLRIVSLSPAITETLYALDLGAYLVARSRYCDYPIQTTSLPMVGSALVPDFERIAALAPNVIVTENGQTSHLSELAALAEVVAVQWLTLEDVISSITTLGQRFGRAQKARELVRRLAVLRAPPPEGAPRVLFLLGGAMDGAPMWFVRRNSLHGAALHAAGYRNAIERDVVGDATLSIEGLLALDPDAVVVLSALPEGAANEAVILERFDALPPLQAVRNDRVLVVFGAQYLRTGPRVIDLAALLAQRLAQVWTVHGDVVDTQ